MVTLDSIITSTTPEEQQKELEEKMILFSPSSQEAIRSLLAKGRRLDQIILPLMIGEGGKIWMSPDFDEPLEEFAEYMPSDEFLEQIARNAKRKAGGDHAKSSS